MLSLHIHVAAMHSRAACYHRTRIHYKPPQLAHDRRIVSTSHGSPYVVHGGNRFRNHLRGISVTSNLESGHGVYKTQRIVQNMQRLGIHAPVVHSRYKDLHVQQHGRQHAYAGIIETSHPHAVSRSFPLQIHQRYHHFVGDGSGGTEHLPYRCHALRPVISSRKIVVEPPDIICQHPAYHTISCNMSRMQPYRNGRPA